MRARARLHHSWVLEHEVIWESNYNFEQLEDNKMSKMRRDRKDHAARKQIAQMVKRRLTLLIAFLVVILFALLFRVGDTWWPRWMTEHRTSLEGIILLAVICLILASPLIIEADSNPRALSGPGKNPKGPRLE